MGVSGAIEVIMKDELFGSIDGVPLNYLHAYNSGNYSYERLYRVKLLSRPDMALFGYKKRD